MKFLTLILAYILSLQAVAQTINNDKITLGRKGSSDPVVLEAQGTDLKIRFNRSEDKIQFSKDGVLFRDIGSGSGGGAGAVSMLENGGFEDGVTSGWESTSSTVTELSGGDQLLGEKSAQFDPSAQNDYLRTSYFTVPKGLRGAACEARLLYTGGDSANYSARVETESGVVLGAYRNHAGNNVLPAHSIPGYESIFYACPTEADIATLATNGNVRLVIYQGTSSDAAPMVVDDVHLGGLIGLVETTLPDVMSFSVSTSSGSVTNESHDFINGNCSVDAPGRVTCNYNQTYSSALACSITSGSNSSSNICKRWTDSASSLSIFCFNSGTGTGADNEEAKVTCQKVGADAKQSVQVYKSIPKVADFSNTFSFTNASGGTTAENQNVPWIASTTNPSGGLYNYNFISGVFSSRPNCTCSPGPFGSATDYKCTINEVSTTGLTINTTIASGNSNFGHTIQCSRSDHKTPTVQPIVLGQVTNSVSEGSALSNVRVEACRIDNSGSASIHTGSGLCGWVQSATRDSTGRVTVVFVTGTFSSSPVCTVNSLTTSAEGAGFVGGYSNTQLQVFTINSSAASTDASFNLTCVGKR